MTIMVWHKGRALSEVQEKVYLSQFQGQHIFHLELLMGEETTAGGKYLPSNALNPYDVMTSYFDRLTSGSRQVVRFVAYGTLVLMPREIFNAKLI